MNRCVASAAVAALSLGGPALAEIVTVRYDFPEFAGVSLLYGYFGGDLGPIDSGRIISTTLVIESYVTTGSTDAGDFWMGFAVPVENANLDFIGLTGADLGWSGQGSFSYALTTSDFNGDIRPGRFGAEWDGGGTFVGQAYVEFTVDTAVPAPGALALLGLGGLATGRRRR